MLFDGTIADFDPQSAYDSLASCAFFGTYEMLMERQAAYPWLGGFSPTLEVPWIIYRLGQKIYMIWYENARSFALKASLIETYGLRGFSAWVLGSEDPGIWGVIGNG